MDRTPSNRPASRRVRIAAAGVPAKRLLQTYCLALLKGARLWRQIADRAVDGFGVSEATAYPLVFMARLGDGIRQAVLAEALGMEGPSLVRLLDRLCAAGLVRRREDATDKRAKTLPLTPRGAALTATLIHRLDEARSQVFADIGDDELRTALTVFDALDRAATAPATAAEPVS